MGRKIPILRVVGLGPNKEFVMAGVFKYENTHGIYLIDILERFKEENILVCWPSYIMESVSFGKNKNSIIDYILNSIVESKFISFNEMSDFKIKLLSCFKQITKGMDK